MFGGDNVPPKRPHKHLKRNYNRQDILIPGTTPGSYGHFGREPNTDYHVKYLHYQQKRDSFDDMKQAEKKKKYLQDAITTKYENHAVKKRLQRSIQDRVDEKLKAYEETVEARRRRLQELLCKEERAFYYQTVDQAQKGAERKMEEMKQKAEALKARREEERLELVHKKRIEQYQERCQDLRPHLAKKNLMESKYSQLQQIRENEAKREVDRELDKMWYELTVKEAEAKKEREVQELLERRNKEKEMLKVWDMQIKGKELLKEEMDKVAQEDRLEMQKLSEQLRREEIEALDAKIRKKDSAAQQIIEQMAIQKKLEEQRKKEENALDQAFNTLAQLELEREKAAIVNASGQARKETAMYRKHLKELEAERKHEEKKLNELLEIHRKEIERKQDEAKCKIVEAKRKLQRDVLAERAEQLRYKKQEAEQQLKLKEAENELLRMAFETNERLQAESDRLEKQASMQYRDDLSRQIAYNNVLRQREREELERQLAEGLREEEKYREITKQMLSGELEMGVKHPFRAALEQSNCYCPMPNK
ncbi:cilia- and flagella-associated protein 53-like [Anthonomus grandis grandis]|uniref:cilia- and flagella-associated protein 53-like n=1 Tax=Anthonomus grandis grandis TaxID=2921223 RepID=UPI0021667CB5|nr:cilia- and flagella-associated protein 53-like [Anthonomus grandis grandis]